MNVLFSFFSPLTYLFGSARSHSLRRKFARARNLTRESEVVLFLLRPIRDRMIVLSLDISNFVFSLLTCLFCSARLGLFRQICRKQIAFDARSISPSPLPNLGQDVFIS